MADFTDPLTGQRFNDGAGAVDPETLGHERAPFSQTGAGYAVAAGEWKCVEVDHADGDTTLWPGPALLAAYEVSEAFSAHAWTIEGSNAPTETIAASATLGTAKTFPPGGGGPLGQVMDTKLLVSPNASATAGKLRVWFRPLDNRATWVS